MFDINSLNISSLVAIVLALIDGLIFGVAIKRAIVSVILAVIGFALAAYIGINIPGISSSTLLDKVPVILAYVTSVAPQFLIGVPIFFIIGLAIGIWKG
ncbi:MAG: hypothetical protein JRN61_02975 [Nitrososphaerota archaeon]|nr:hypothetical protein [Nitrososphaerota archaeon]